MKAAVLYEPGTPLVVEDLQLDPPKAGEVEESGRERSSSGIGIKTSPSPTAVALR